MTQLKSLRPNPLGLVDDSAGNHLGRARYRRMPSQVCSEYLEAVGFHRASCDRSSPLGL